MGRRCCTGLALTHWDGISLAPCWLANLAGGRSLAAFGWRGDWYGTGAAGGILRRLVDRLIARICDVLSGLSGDIAGDSRVAVLGSGIANVSLLQPFSIPASARPGAWEYAGAGSNRRFIESARSIGASDATIIFNHILPERSLDRGLFTMRIRHRRSSLPQACHFWIRRTAADAGVGARA